MAKRPLKGDIERTPVVDLKKEEGSKLVGVLKDTAESKYGHIYRFILETTDGSTSLKNEAGEIQEVEVKPGDTVALFASSYLDADLQKAKIEERIEVIWHGLKQNPKTGRSFNDYEANVLE